MIDETDSPQVGYLEGRIRSFADSSWPDWMHMKAIQISRIVDEHPHTGNLFLILNALAMERRLRLLEMQIGEMTKK